MQERIQKLMAQANVGSRRACEELIRQGRVEVNGKLAQLGDQADPQTDIITVDGTRLVFSALKRYFAINKPINVLSSNVSDGRRQTVRELIPYQGHLFMIGRLDAESDGLMVLTNDGEMANQLTHPRYEHTKTYKVVVYGTPTQEVLDKWERGVFLEEGLTAPCSIRVQQREHSVTVMRIVMVEGKKRHIRRVAAMLGYPVKRLTRSHIGKLELGTLKQGEWYELNEQEVEKMNTPASDLGYIRKLRREQREIKRKQYLTRQKTTAQTPPPGYLRDASLHTPSAAAPTERTRTSSTNDTSTRKPRKTNTNRSSTGGTRKPTFGRTSSQSQNNRSKPTRRNIKRK